MSETVNRWKEQAQYDLVTARAMLDSGRFLYVLFCCQQSVEKALKALIIQKTENFPPRIHNLLQLSEYAGIQLSSERKQFFGELTTYYIQSRYPEEIRKLSSAIRQEIAEKILNQTEAVIQWLFSMPI